MKTCFVFPGQGAQYPGMAKDLFDSSPRVRELFNLAEQTTGIDVKELLFNGSEEDLKETVNTQVSITLANLSAAAVLEDRGFSADACAGFSLGEYAALVQSQVLTAAQVFPLVKLRGEAMARASDLLDRSEGDPGMAAVVGLSPDAVEKALALSGIPGIFAANYNSPVQVVISGTAPGLKAASEVLKAAGARRIITLKVSGPFHSPLLKSASEELAKVFEMINFENPRIPLYSNVTGGLITSGAQARELAILQVISPVKWTLEENALLQAGYDRIIEAGPGAVLVGLWGATGSEVPIFSAGKLEQIDQIK
ncbi:MAG: malonyl CoA-ACP transacylase [Spirochaetes bacterium GWB1_48_6]|nr:MAG: malonyl CoA-ACP transacylase [Spirochaetes bacterium GWB1_48_6]